MQDPKQIWEFGRWIAQQDSGSARLSWAGGEVVLGVRQGRIHSAEGLESDELADRLGCDGSGEDDLLAEARSLGQLHDIPETRAMGAAKEILQGALHQWLLDPDRRFSVDDGEPLEVDGATISITHALVELVLADTEHNVADSILPDSEIVLQRAGSFIELYAPLRLSEEADQEMSVSMKFESIKDFDPEAIAKNTPELNKLLKLREALNSLKGPMSNRPEFRKKVQELIKDEAAREQLLKELKLEE